MANQIILPEPEIKQWQFKIDSNKNDDDARLYVLYDIFAVIKSKYLKSGSSDNEDLDDRICLYMQGAFNLAELDKYALGAGIYIDEKYIKDQINKATD